MWYKAEVELLILLGSQLSNPYFNTQRLMASLNPDRVTYGTFMLFSLYLQAVFNKENWIRSCYENKMHRWFVNVLRSFTVCAVCNSLHGIYDYRTLNQRFAGHV